MEYMQIHRGKMQQILQAYSLPKETVTVIVMVDKNMKAMDCTSDGHSKFFDIVTGVLQGDTFAPYLFILCLIYCKHFLTFEKYFLFFLFLDSIQIINYIFFILKFH